MRTSSGLTARIGGLGLARVDANMVGATAAMLGDWDLQSTLLRRAIQAGSRLLKSSDGEGRGPFLATNEDAMAGYERRLLVASRTVREDAVSRYLLPIVEEFATEKLMETGVRPGWLVQAGLVMTVGAAFCFSRGWHWGALALLFLSTPLDLVAQRLATLRLQPLSPSMLSRRLLWPAAGLALVALGWFETNHGSGWGAMMAALGGSGICRSRAGRTCRTDRTGRRMAFLAAYRRSGWRCRSRSVAGGRPISACLAIYAATSFFIAQHYRHNVRTRLTAR